MDNTCYRASFAFLALDFVIGPSSSSSGSLSLFIVTSPSLYNETQLIEIILVVLNNKIIMYHLLKTLTIFYYFHDPYFSQ